MNTRSVYRRRKFCETVLYQVLQEHLKTFEVRVEGEGASTLQPEYRELVL